MKTTELKKKKKKKDSFNSFKHVSCGHAVTPGRYLGVFKEPRQGRG